jgi:hypothetical protein
VIRDKSHSAESIRARLLNRAKADNVEFQQMLTRFALERLKADEIRLDASYSGIRVNLIGTLAGARCPVQADIGFGDAVTPGPEDTTYPTLHPIATH